MSKQRNEEFDFSDVVETPQGESFDFSDVVEKKSPDQTGLKDSLAGTDTSPSKSALPSATQDGLSDSVIRARQQIERRRQLAETGKSDIPKEETFAEKIRKVVPKKTETEKSKLFSAGYFTDKVVDVNGEKITKAEIINKLYDNDFIENLQAGKIKITHDGDPEIQQLIARQAKSGTRLGDKWESLVSGAYTVASGAANVQHYVNDILREVGLDVPYSLTEQIGSVGAQVLKKKAEESIEETRQYQGGFLDAIARGDWVGAADMGSNTVAQSAPISVAAALTGGGVAGAGLLTGIMAAEEYGSGDKYENLTRAEEIFRAGVYGGLEAIPEAGITGKIVAKNFKLFKDGIRSQIRTATQVAGEEAGQKVAQELGKKTAKEFLKEYGIDVGKEALGEGLVTELGQMMTDDFMGVHDYELADYIKNVSEATALGAFGGAVMGAPTAATGLKKFADERLKKDPEGLKAAVDTRVEKGTMTAEQGEAVKENIDSRAAAVNAVPDNMVENTKVVDLVQEKQKLEEQKKALDPVFQPPVDEQIEKVEQKIAKAAGIPIEEKAEEKPAKTMADDLKVGDTVEMEVPKTEVVSYEDAIKITPKSELTNPEQYGTDELGRELKTAALRDQEKEPPSFTEHKIGTYAKDKYGDLYQLQNVPIEKIVLPEGESKREETVSKYRKWIKEGSNPPPSKGVENYAEYGGKVVINDGHHRIVAAKQEGQTEVPVWVSLTDPKYPARPIQDITYHQSILNEGQKTNRPEKQTQGSIGKVSGEQNARVVREVAEGINRGSGLPETEKTKSVTSAKLAQADALEKIGRVKEAERLRKSVEEVKPNEAKLPDTFEEFLQGEKGINDYFVPKEQKAKERWIDSKRTMYDRLKEREKPAQEAAVKTEEITPSEPIKPEISETPVAETTEGAGEGKKAVAGRVYEGSTPEQLKVSVEKHGLNYPIESHVEAEKIASNFLAEVGTENALKAVRENQVEGGAAPFVWGKIIDEVHKEFLAESNTKKKLEIAEREAALIDEFGKKAKTGGQFTSALQAVYQVSDVGYMLGGILNRAKEANQGELPDVVKNKLAELSAKLDEATKKLTELESRPHEAQVIIKEFPKEQRASLSPEKSARKKELSAKYRSQFNDITRMITLLGEKDFREYVSLVFEEAAGDFKYFSRELINNVGKGIQEYLPKLYKDLGGKDPQIVAIQKNLKKQIGEYERRLREKDFTRKKKGEPPTLDEETFELQVERNKLKDEIDLEIERLELKQRPLKDKIADNFVDAMNLPKSLVASADMSAPLRQGAVLSAGNLTKVPAALKTMFQHAFSEKKANDWLARIKTTGAYDAMKKAGLYIAEPYAKLTAREEQFVSSIAHKIPIWGHVVKGSQRAYVGYLNKLRADVFADFHDALVKDGFTGEKLNTELKSFAEFVNNASGRGSLGKFEEAAPLLNSVFFSPRYVASRFNLINPMTYVKMSPRARRAALKNIGSYIGIGMAVLALAKAGGADVEDDPRSADFGKIQVGNVRYDIWAGFQQWVRLISQLATGEKKTLSGNVQTLGEGYKTDTRLDIIERFARSKASPTAGFAADMLAGKDVVGNEVTVPSEVMDLIIPLWSSDLLKIQEEQGLKGAIPAAAASFFGVGVQQIEPKKKSTVNLPTVKIK